jgi:hypothetical protein
MIQVNGRDFDEHGLKAKAEARKRAGLYDSRLLGLLERDIRQEIEEHVFSMIQVVYDLQRSLEDAGARLEPPTDLSTGEPEQRKSRAGSILRRLQTRFIRAVNEGYVQQQEKYNTFFTKAVDISYRQLCGALGGIVLSEVAQKRDVWISRRPQWGESEAGSVCEQGRDGAVVLGIPGVSLLEFLQEKGRLLLALDTSDLAAADAQSRFLPAWFHPQPLEVLENLITEDLGLLVVAFPECLTGEELEGLLYWAGARMGEGGKVLIALNAVWEERVSCDDGFVRFWPRRFLAALMERHGMKPLEWRAGEMIFLKGEMGA